MATAPVRSRSPSRVPGAVHIHSTYSHDGHDTLERIRDWAASAGVRFVAMTDHAEDFTEARFREYRDACGALSTDRVRLIPGLEFRFPHHRGLHLLACGLEQFVQPPTLEAFAKEVADAAQLVILAHPILTAYRVPGVVGNCIDAIEVWNASYNTRYLPDPRAISLLRAVRRERPAVVAVAGLDQHDASNDRQTRVVLNDERDLADPLVAIREGRFTNSGQTMSFPADADLSAPAFGALVAARTVFDRIERTQERLTRAWRRRQTGRVRD